MDLQRCLARVQQTKNCLATAAHLVAEPASANSNGREADPAADLAANSNGRAADPVADLAAAGDQAPG